MKTAKSSAVNDCGAFWSPYERDKAIADFLHISIVAVQSAAEQLLLIEEPLNQDIRDERQRYQADIRAKNKRH